MGFPLVRVLKEDWQADKVTLELDQVWFLADGSELSEKDAEKKWTIPITTCTEAGTQADMTLMREKTATVTIPTTSWVKLNAGQEVPMRVLPGTEMLKRLSAGIINKTLGPIDRAALLSDAYALVKAGHMEPDKLIQLVGNYKEEDNYIVWEGLAAVFGGLNTVLSDDEKMSGYFKEFAKGFVLNLMALVGWEPKDSDGHLTTMLRGIMVNLLSTFAYDDAAVVKEATARFRAFQADHSDAKSLPGDMRTQVFKIFLKNGGNREYDEVKSYFNEATDNAEKKHVLSSLGSIQDPKLKLAAMEWSTSGEVKLQDGFYVAGGVSHSAREGREISWKYFKDNFEKIKGMLASAHPSLMGAWIVMCGGSFCSKEKADELQKFFEDHPLPKCSLKITQTIEATRSNAKLLDILKASNLSQADFWKSL